MRANHLGSVCDEPGCPTLVHGVRCARHERNRQQIRNAQPERVALYRGDWPAESRRLREQQPWCSVDGCERTDLSVDHPTRSVLCLHHHGQLEARRRALHRPTA